ncbi:hypothetical protein CSV80_16150 [Sporosarcina sp. P12(2017)]|uniref:hypothetical protein n=1 Tax=unclassified Sporosarcina TaxID=2647733 RepID=UPI000C166B75|nr:MULTISPECIES: hypothetical protein [unclassified Sporosarcina]PIC56087.1 hypothetical protein CSV81_16370 [Sporosarcina sp. P10]PIC59384.1 hypothetical protein CSV80_16150 [Sporosarcina sp. P12(2017)]
MADLSKEQRTTVEQREQYGREMDARNAAMENIEVPLENRALADHEIPPPLTEEEVRAKVGNQNYQNATDDNAPTSIGS